MSKNRRFIKLVSVALVCVMVMVMCMGAYGGENVARSIELNLNITNYEVKVANVSDVNSYGSNIGTDYSSSSNTIDSQNYSIVFNASINTLEIMGEINGETINVEGNLAAINENSDMLLYSSEITNFDLEVAYLGVAKNPEDTMLYFEDYQSNNLQYNNVVQLYLKNKSSEEFIFIEIFLVSDFVGFVLDNIELEYVSEVSMNLQYWFINYFESIPSTASNNSTNVGRANTDIRIQDMSKTYNIMGSITSFNFVIQLYYTVPNIAIGGGGYGECYFHVIKSDITSNQPSMASSTQGYLALHDLNIKISSSPYLAITAITPVRYDIERSWGVPTINFDVSFGVNIGLLSSTGTFSFTDSYTANSSQIMIPRTDSKGGKAVEIGLLPRNYFLQNVGSKYGFTFQFLELLKTDARSAFINVRFDSYVNNGYEYVDSYPEVFTDTATIQIG